MITHLKAWIGLLFLQAAWSYRRMQTLGWLLIALPFARRRQASPAALLGRLVVHFNSHPLLAPLVLGAGVRALQPDSDVSDEEAANTATQRLIRWMGTFGALGDMLYWRGLTWNLGWIAVVTYLVADVTGLVVLALLWLAAEIGVRIYLFEQGFRHPEQIPVYLKRFASPALRSFLQRLGLTGIAVAAGMIFGLMLHTPSWVPTGRGHIIGAVAAVLAVGVAVKTRFRSSVLWLPILLWAAFGLLE